MAEAIEEMNPHLKTLNGRVDMHAQYSTHDIFNYISYALTRTWLKSQKTDIYMLSYVLVLAQVDKYAEIEYSMVESPLISNSSIDLSLKVSWSWIPPEKKVYM